MFKLKHRSKEPKDQHESVEGSPQREGESLAAFYARVCWTHPSGLCAILPILPETVIAKAPTGTQDGQARSNCEKNGAKLRKTAEIYGKLRSIAELPPPPCTNPHDFPLASFRAGRGGGAGSKQMQRGKLPWVVHTVWFNHANWAFPLLPQGANDTKNEMSKITPE